MGQVGSETAAMGHVERGVIDRFEGDLAVVVLDDGRQLRWPRAGLPAGCRPGTAVRLELVTVVPRASGGIGADDVAARSSDTAARAHLPVRVQRGASGGDWQLQLPDGSTLDWPAVGPRLRGDDVRVRGDDAAAATASLALTPDADDTAARRQRVSGLVDDIFGASGPDRR